MIIEQSKTEEGTILRLEGWLDTQTAPELKAVVDELDENLPAVLDLQALEYISSAGLRQIVATHKKTGGKLTLRNVSPDILDILKMAGFDKRLHIES